MPSLENNKKQLKGSFVTLHSYNQFLIIFLFCTKIALILQLCLVLMTLKTELFFLEIP
jgi:hypothetical protein